VKFSSAWVPSHGDRILRRFESDLFPWLGRRPVADIRAPELLSVLRRIESRGAVETAHRALQNCGQVFRYAIATSRAERDPTGDVRGALPPPLGRSPASSGRAPHLAWPTMPDLGLSVPRYEFLKFL
jgi:integrase